VVRGLVEEQHVRPSEQHLRQQHAQLEAAGERRERLPVERHRDAEALEDRARAGLERVAVVRADAILELDEPRGVGGVARGLRDEGALFFERAHHELVAGHRHVEDHVLVAHEAILAEDPARAPLSMATLPSDACSSPETISRNVVLPDPFAPTRP